MSDPLARARQAIAREDADAAVALLLPLAQSGDVEAQFLLGSRFVSPVDLLPLADAIEWLRRASDAGHPAATYELALFHGEDEDEIYWGPPTTADAVALLVRAGELGSVEAQYDLGALYATGDWAGPTDAAAARDWYRRAAEQGQAGAQANLGGMFLDGKGGAVDVAEGLRWLEAAAAQDHAGALQRLAWVYTDGLADVPADPARAAEYRRREEAAG
jgi:TPR repeat protein